MMAKSKNPVDLGLQVVNRYREQMSIDDAWLEPQERGFAWWSGPLAQRVWASPPWQDEEGDLFQIVAETDVCTGGTTEDSMAALDATLGAVPLSSMVRHFETRTFRLRCSVVVHAAVAVRLGRLFCLAASLQQSLAYRVAKGLTEEGGFRPAISGHPRSGHRAEFDEMARIATNLFRPMGEKPSVWNDRAEHAEVANSLRAFGLAAEAGNPDLGPLWLGVRLGHEPGDITDPAATAMIMLDAETAHPAVGNGAVLYLVLPPGLAEAHPDVTPLDLNDREAAELDHPHVIGSWVPPPPEASGGFLYNCFLPNIVHDPGLLFDLFAAMASRARWGGKMLPTQGA